MANYAKTVSRKNTPQTQPIPGKAMVENNAGGFVFETGKWAQLNRFLVLGAEGGTYYVGEHKLTKQNATNVEVCIKEDGLRVVNTILEMSVSGRAPKNDPAIFALALCTADGDEATKKAAYAAIDKVCRTGTHLFHFCQAVQELRGWSRGLRNGVSKFYTEKDAKDVAYQMVKYRQRDGWTHKDVLKLAHPTPKGADMDAIFKWTLGKEVDLSLEGPTAIVSAFKEAQSLEPAFVDGADSKSALKRIVELVVKYNLPWEALPTASLKHKAIWEAILPKMPLGAMVRNLGRLASIGLTESNLDDYSKIVASKLGDVEALKKGKVHPLFVLNALRTYSSGHGNKGSMTWKPVGLIKDSLEEAFYTTFGVIEPTGKNWLLGLDVSGSMSGGQVAGMSIAPFEAVACMAMVTARVEKSNEIYGFTSTFQDLGITAKDTLEGAMKKAQKSNFGSTDCSLPMEYAIEKKIKVDAFCVYTDNETYAGNRQPVQALNAYRKAFNPNAKLIVIGLTSTGFTIADPNDAGMLDVVGFDSAAPQVMADFVRQSIA
jgi:60 kDa SS-A/Ro ribonucleoprotein